MTPERLEAHMQKAERALEVLRAAERSTELRLEAAKALESAACQLRRAIKKEASQ